MSCVYDTCQGSVSIRLPNYFGGTEIIMEGSFPSWNPDPTPIRNKVCGTAVGMPFFSNALMERNRNPIVLTTGSRILSNGYPSFWWESQEGIQEFQNNWNKCWTAGFIDNYQTWMSATAIIDAPFCGRVDSPCGLYGHLFSKMKSSPFIFGQFLCGAYPYDFTEGDFIFGTARFVPEYINKTKWAIECSAAGSVYGYGELEVLVDYSPEG